MLLSCRFLNDVQGVNSFESAAQVEFAAGDSQSLYFQLVDATLDRADQGFNPPGRRYVPPVGSTAQVTLVNVDDAKRVSRAATQPFAQDASIWSMPVLANDQLHGTVNMNLVLTEPSRVLNARFSPGVLLRFR